MLFTSSLNVFDSLYLSSVSQLNVGCFMVGLPILGPTMLCIHSTHASAMVWIVTLAATALVIASLIICSVAIICLILLV